MGNMIVVLFFFASVLMFVSALAGIPLVQEFRTNSLIVVSNLKSYESLQSSDVSLLKWIRDGTPTGSVFLITAGDAGQYLAAISGHPAIYIFGPQLYSAKYNYLIEALNSDPSDATIVPIMLDYNISYIYVGSRPVNNSSDWPFRIRLDAEALLNSPYFRLVNRIGDSYVLEFDRGLATELGNTSYYVLARFIS